MSVAIIVDHSYHQKTQSSSFFHDFLKDCFHEVYEFWDESWHGGPNIKADEINAVNPDAVFIFQILYPASYYDQLSCSKIFIVPMYDGALGWSDQRWLRWRKLNFINYSLTLHNRFIGLGMRSFYIQYFPEPMQYIEEIKKDGILWPHRSALINERVVAALFHDSEIKEIIIHETKDPNIEPINASYLRANGYSVAETHWFKSKNEYLEYVRKSLYFISPREFEGIGFTFLEAMAAGTCVVAPDNPTMNEYIINGENGILYDPANPQPRGISENDPIQLGKAARNTIEKGRENYLIRLEALRKVLVDTNDKYWEIKVTCHGIYERCKFNTFTAMRHIARSLKLIARRRYNKQKVENNAHSL